MHVILSLADTVMHYYSVADRGSGAFNSVTGRTVMLNYSVADRESVACNSVTGRYSHALLFCG